jgi:malonyl-CoA O-methyltransferase
MYTARIISPSSHAIMSVVPTQSKMSAPIDLLRVREFFSRPARVQPSDFLRREIAARMHERLQLVKIAPRRVLDAGCGPGADLAMLQKDFPAAQIVGLDAAPAMLAAAAVPAGVLAGLNQLMARLLPAKAGIDLLCGDFADLALQSNAVDLVWSNLALHWHPQPDAVFAEWRRVLRENGLLMFSCFGPDTFKELKDAFAHAGLAPPALPFVDMHDFGDMLVNVGFATPVLDMETITVTYDSASALLADVRAWGGNPLATRRRGLTGRPAWQRMLLALERLRRPDGKLGLSFEIIYGHAFRPLARVNKAGEAIIRFDLPRSPR